MSIKRPRIHLDSGNPEETKKAKGILGFLDGQTTNPSLIAKNPDIVTYVQSGKKMTEKELLDRYKEVVVEIGKEVAGPISVETYADWDTKAETMLAQAEEMFTWGRTIYIKFPSIPEGIKAAHEFVKKGGRVNMTLVFDLQQAAAIYTATIPGSQPSFISPFMGRWDDRGYQGTDLLRNIQKLYRIFDKKREVKKSHMLTLAASIRSLDHFYSSIFMGADMLTVPYSILYEWVQEETWIPDERYRVPMNGLKSILFEEVPFHSDFTKYDIKKEPKSLLDEGLTKFQSDWKNLLSKP